ncbi:type II toxin-antitoxin system RelE/ParE family toxin [Moraxella bovis]|uniref:Type II toxin-antitoxin system RelE/ParE family toxin n=1 Tax=Moraxella bovis TaxID=476 RepID=A0AAQ2Q8E9_MORBO|nr:type II toxin-antitoxin system RelE/ParE family toxin [Moraxella bovis]AWY21465.1 benzoate transporter [Moraxella bovis]UYZ75651.1 type II toxin-antitoxin system RelE/ParE family toxin [Moraxella bovis]UYZ78407.1 type II toxin-antitoxin system RelE/ParE family toxin [Moraxella bovis]UYZ81294.1 type II toxin-antitoxin system RelE/ParE family toxin [Moraxella bovis]UYZ86889.1 type II toxin-antitoxin system RelE/ParE family toxin [Moraxella bovis]
MAYDPKRQVILLCAGDKTGDKRFYQRMIPLAERIYGEYLKDKSYENLQNPSRPHGKPAYRTP